MAHLLIIFLFEKSVKIIHKQTNKNVDLLITKLLLLQIIFVNFAYILLKL